MRTQIHSVAIFLFLTTFIMPLMGCKNTTEEATTTSNKTIEISEENRLNTLVDDPENKGEKMLLGIVNQDGFNNTALFPWMSEEYKTYKPDPLVINLLAKNLNKVTIKAFMGTWCEDSQREIPRFYKILALSNFKLSNMEIVAVSHDKDTPTGLEKGLAIEYVPTFIFYKNGTELGRFVEYAQETLEEDLVAILTGAPYKHAYQE